VDFFWRIWGDGERGVWGAKLPKEKEKDKQVAAVRSPKLGKKKARKNVPISWEK